MLVHGDSTCKNVICLRYFKDDFISQLCKIFGFFRIFTQLKLNENRYIDTMLFTLY